MTQKSAKRSSVQLMPLSIATAMLEWERIKLLPNDQRGNKDEMIPVSIFEVLHKWELLRHLPDFQVREKIMKKIKNGRMCSRKAARSQARAVIRLTGELAQSFSPEAQKTNRFAKRYLKKKGVSFDYRVQQYGPARIAEVVLHNATV